MDTESDGGSSMRHCADWLARIYTRSQTSIPFMDMVPKRYIAERYIGYQVVNGHYIGVMKCQIELLDGTVKDVWELVPEQVVSPDSKMFYLEEPPMDIRFYTLLSSQADTERI